MAETPASSPQPRPLSERRGKRGLGVVRSGRLGPRRSQRAVGCGSGARPSGARVGVAAGAVSLTGVFRWQLVTTASTGSRVVRAALWLCISGNSGIPAVLWHVCDFNFLLNFCWKEGRTPRVTSAEDLCCKAGGPLEGLSN